MPALAHKQDVPVAWTWPNAADLARVEMLRARLSDAIRNCPHRSERMVCERFLRMADHVIANWSRLNDAALFGPNWHGPAIEMAIRSAGYGQKAAQSEAAGDAP